jgi:acyl-CoA reductase-like NAD-dependent aldehyde dehydrogenase
MRYTPLGVCVGIVPWNFPIVLAINKIAPAVMSGNTVIIKPSPFTPYCGIKLVELAQRFFPPGVIQVLSGNDSLGPWLTSHPGPAKISFTGSSFTGKKVMESASKTLKRVTLELYVGTPHHTLLSRETDKFPSIEVAMILPSFALTLMSRLLLQGYCDATLHLSFGAGN